MTTSTSPQVNRVAIEDRLLEDGRWEVESRTTGPGGGVVVLAIAGRSRRNGWRPFSLKVRIWFDDGEIEVEDVVGNWRLAFAGDVPNRVVRDAILAAEQHARLGH